MNVTSNNFRSDEEVLDDRESELRTELAEAMMKVGKKCGHK